MMDTQYIHICLFEIGNSRLAEYVTNVSHNCLSILHAVRCQTRATAGLVLPQMCRRARLCSKTRLWLLKCGTWRWWDSSLCSCMFQRYTAQSLLYSMQNTLVLSCITFPMAFMKHFLLRCTWTVAISQGPSCTLSYGLVEMRATMCSPVEFV